MASSLAMSKGLSPVSLCSPSRSLSVAPASLRAPASRVAGRRSLVRCSNAEGPRRPSLTPPPSAPAPPSPPAAVSAPVTAVTERPSSSPSPSLPSSPPSASVVTVEFQRQRAKEMQAYFQDLKFETKVRDLRVFGWTRKNEITNGRWTMFGFAVGLLTEFATGVDFPNQLKIIVSNLGIADLD